MPCQLKKTIAVFLSFAAALFYVQLFHLSKLNAHSSDAISFQVPAIAKGATDNKIVADTSNRPLRDDGDDITLPHNYKCFPPRHWSSPNITNTVVYIELPWVNLHSETFYSFVHYFCSCEPEKFPQWKLDPSSVPHFYFGPDKFVKSDLRRILAEYNKTTCGPILFGTPSNPKVTLHTTTYGQDWYGKNPNFHHLDKINVPGHIFICHDDAPKIESVQNIFFLTPAHSRYIVPSYFPPTIVERSQRALEAKPNHPPVFLVMGSFYVKAGNQKRNIASLKEAMSQQSEKNFTIHFLGGGADKTTNETLIDFIKEHFHENFHTVKVTPNSEADVFMDNVGAADVILPLLDETNFRLQYQKGKRLSSAISWALGFDKRIVLYRPLAEVFGLEEASGKYWLYDNATHFSTVFAHCLDAIY